jgi:membrane protein
LRGVPQPVSCLYISSMNVIARTLDVESKVSRWAINLYGTLVSRRRWFAVLVASLRRFWEQRIYYYSGYFTYNAFLAILALLVVAIAVVGYISPSSPAAQEAILNAFKTLRPVLGDNPQEALSQMQAYRQVIGILGVLALIWTGTKLFRALEWGFSEITGCKRRSYLKGRLLGMLLISIIGLAFTLAIVFNLIVSTLWSAIAGEQGFFHDVGIYALSPIISLTLNTALFVLMYRLIPTVKQRFRYILIGAVVAGGLMLLVQYGLSFYFSVISDVPTTYGSISFAIVLILFVHVVGMISFFGEELVYVMGNEDIIEDVTMRQEEMQEKMLAIEERLTRRLKERLARSSEPPG